MEEFWKPIPFANGRYEVSTNGNIRSYANGRWADKMEPHLLKPKVGTNGYLIVILRDRNKSLCRSIHRFVAEAFIEKPEGKDFVNHKDGNKWNNRVENLEWVTASENSYHAVRTGLLKPSEKQKKAASESRAKVVYGRRVGSERWIRFKSISYAGMKTRADASEIAKCCKEAAKTAKDYEWSYVLEDCNVDAVDFDKMMDGIDCSYIDACDSNNIPAIRIVDLIESAVELSELHGVSEEKFIALLCELDIRGCDIRGCSEVLSKDYL